MLPKSWSLITPYLLFNSVTYLIGAILFGLDTGSFGSLQALPAFLNTFGVEGADGVFSLPATRRALMNSLPWIGKIAGCFLSDWFIDRGGYKKTMYAAAGIQIIGIILEVSAKHWLQFTIGRDVAYFAVGLVENAVPSYNAETSPAAVRGLLSGSLMFFTALGNLWGAGMSRAFATEQDQIGWLIPTSMQFIPAVLILALVPFTPESPRWLLLKGKRELAQEKLNMIRHKAEVEDGSTSDLFSAKYIRQTWICATLFAVQQNNGNQFVQSYAATFYVEQGLGAMSFTYNMIGQAIGIVGCLAGTLLFDVSGRRPLFVGGIAVAAFLLYLGAGIGDNQNPNQTETRSMVSCFMILPFFTRISATNCAFLTGAEIGGVRMRKKIMAFGLTIDVLAAFLVTFVTPYILPTLQAKIGWIFGSVCAFAGVWGWFFFPELKGRSLEEVDELFDARIWAWQFSKYQTTGTAGYLTEVENKAALKAHDEANVEHGNLTMGTEKA